MAANLVLVASSVLMEVTTCVIGLLPTAAAIGWAAPPILIARILQGFALGGQWGGASPLLTEGAAAGESSPARSIAVNPPSEAPTNTGRGGRSTSSTSPVKQVTR